MKKNYILIAMSCVLLAACSSGQKRLEQGDYDAAVYKAVKRLQQKPQKTKAQLVLREAYTRAVNEHMEVIAFHDKTSNPFKYDQMVQEYQQVNYLNTAIRRYPLYKELLQLVDVKVELAKVRAMAAKSHLKAGDKLLAQGVKQRARDAYHQYVEANRFQAGAASQEKMDAAQDAGTVLVALEFVNSKHFFRDFNTDRVFDEVRNNFRNSRYRFMQVVDPGERDIDHTVQIAMDDAHIGRVDVRKSIIELKKEDVYMGEAETDSGDMVKVYGTVYADYIEYCKTINSRAQLMVQVLDGYTGAVVQRQVIPSQYNWTEKWASYRGDKRALSADQINFAQRSEPNLPSPQWLFAQTSAPLVGRSIDLLSGHFAYLR
jgi:hypothetical protein